MPFFFPNRQVTCLKRTKASVSVVLQLLHDPPALIRLSPLVIDVSVDPADPTNHHIVDSLVMLGYRTTLKYQARIILHDDGITAHVVAGAGTRTVSRYTVRTIDEETEIEEVVAINGFFLFMPFITNTIQTAHSESLDRLAAALEKETWCVYSPTSNALDFLSFLFALWLFKRSAADPYGLFHLSLNELPTDTAGPRTEWLNMGYWKVGSILADSILALALKLIQAAACQPGGSVLDVGHGSGESLILLLTHAAVPRPARVTGITSLEVHHRRSQARVARLHQDVSVTLYQGDAVFRPGCRGNHPLDPAHGAQFDTILALDCAYHFQIAGGRLRPGGAIALADICFAPAALQTRRTQLVAAVLRFMPRENMLSTDEYAAQLRAIGYSDFIRFLGSRGLGWYIFARILGVFAGSGGRFVVVRGKRSMSH
ncbi:S-adenosyl-L-methionine-dependent methyltransferase [Mycena rebaudengoi]|nr:S-adenosyl-L-methionine-dependent methyltransferase [Mycena rebaudengoi]